MRIEVWSDVICPWCYLGFHRLDLAIRQLGWDDEVEVHLRAFQLDPSASREPGDLRRAIERKYGPGAFDSMTARLTRLGEAEGLDYRFDRALRVNTHDAHRLLAWADEQPGEQGAAAQAALATRLFQAYFTEGQNVADPATLARLADEAGLDAGAAAEVLASDAYAAEVRKDIDDARDLDIHGVPHFVIEDRFAIPGAQDVDTMAALLERASSRLNI